MEIGRKTKTLINSGFFGKLHAVRNELCNKKSKASVRYSKIKK